MATTVEDIRGWIDEAKEEGATHVIVACDTFDWSDYPVPVMPDEDVHEIYDHYHRKNMQKVMEVYNLNKDVEEQLKLPRSFTF